MGISMTALTSISNLPLTILCFRMTEFRSLSLPLIYLSMYCHLLNFCKQARPSFLPEEQMPSMATSPQLGLQEENCPTGTVPIRRTTKEDLLHSPQMNNSNYIAGIPDVGLVYGEKVYGTSFFLNVWGLKIDPDQYSGSGTWVQNGADVIQAGWIVGRKINGDGRTRSDPSSEDWWLIYNGNIPVGYCPKSLFNALANDGGVISWGGFEARQSAVDILELKATKGLVTLGRLRLVTRMVELMVLTLSLFSLVQTRNAMLLLNMRRKETS
ncbi:hypothetical protein H6P81_017127 [Aristolochia fimbriata]|uniref:Neprosin PEP catalytic domain-containing protein n=1 Tax=Aristolochia fimbriata TaxID=158543 RepID=A0AAV7E1I4_ARIFI|nr:hypothetical protein H6P81_017127 [Aristolochia fimbriata]